MGFLMLFPMLWSTFAQGVGASSNPLDHWESFAALPPSAGLPISAAFGNHRFVAIVNRQVFTSRDAKKWSDARLAANDVAFGNGLFVVAGDPGKIFTSEDAESWTERPWQVPGYEHDLAVTKVAFAGGIFFVVGAGREKRTQQLALFPPPPPPPAVLELDSRDGKEWTGQRSSYINLVSYGKGMIVAVIQSPTLVGIWIEIRINETDGTYTPLEMAYTFRGIAFGNGSFVAVKDPGFNDPSRIAISLDGTNWTPLTFQPPKSLFAITYANNTFVSVGRVGTVLTSTDGRDWRLRSSNTQADLTVVFFADERFVALSPNGMVSVSGQVGPTLSIDPENSGSGFRLTLAAGNGESYRLQSSADLSNWIDLATFTNLQSEAFFHSATPAQPQNFFRLAP